MPSVRRVARQGGRADALNEARDLVALLGTLSREGATIDAHTIARRLGVSEANAAKLIDLVVSAGSPTMEYLPVSLSDAEGESDDGIVLISARGVRGRALRLNQRELTALAAALNLIGVPQDDPLRDRLRSGFSTSDIDELTIRRTLAPLSIGPLSESLLACSQALLSNSVLRFLYRGLSDSEYKPRIAKPQHISHQRSEWYLDATDVERGARRTFRIDRMRKVTPIELPRRAATKAANSTRADESHSHVITLVFSDEHYLSLFEWPGLEVIRRDEGRITARITQYDNNSNWLVRRITACGGTVTTDDEKLMAEVKTYAQHLLDTAQS